MLLPLVLFTVFLAGCASALTAAKPASGQPLPGNRRDEKSVGDGYVETMNSAAKQSKRPDTRFRIYTLFSPDCLMCKSQIEAAHEMQTKRGNVDVTAYNFQRSAAAARNVIPLTILQYGDCRTGIVADGFLNAATLSDKLNELKDSCETFKSIPFRQHFAPIDL